MYCISLMDVKGKNVKNPDLLLLFVFIVLKITKKLLIISDT